MRVSDSIAIISDVHGNRHALEAVRRAQRQAGITRTWCLGDMVGYGAHPNECLRACVHASERCLAGNHDLAAAGRVPVDVFSPWARTAIEWTRTRLDRNALERLDGGLVRGEETISLDRGRWLVNPGSVGQPRDLDPRASWAVLDPDANTLTFRRTPYDVPGAQNAIQAAGLPVELGSRLAEGR